MFTHDLTRIALSHLIAAALAVAGVRVGRHTEGMDGHTVVSLALIAVSTMWIVQVPLVQNTVAQSPAPAVKRV